MNQRSIILSLYNIVINDNHYDQKKQLISALFFSIFIFVGLGIDSVFFLNNYFDGRWIMNWFAIIHFCYFFYVSNAYLRKLMFVMFFLSYLGELLCCNALGMYHYRTDEIPLYVPFGHAILYATGYVFSETKWAHKHKEILRKYFIAFFLIVLIGVGVIFNDILSLLFGLFFFIVVKKRNWQSLYFFVSFCVIVLELVGTYYQCWGWYPKVLWIIPTINPPLGAIFIYVGGDITLNKLVHFLERTIKI